MSGQGIGEILTIIASLTPAQQSVLKEVSLHAGPVTIADLAGESKLHVNTIREPLNVLVSLGLVEREKLPACLLYTSPSPRDQRGSRMPSSA